MNDGRPLVRGATLHVRHARLRGAVPDDRERLRRLLDGVHPAAIGLPDRAILLVPRLVARRQLKRRDDGGLFAGQVADALHTALRTARRPGEARSADDSILFPDELEGAAFLIEQWLAGTPPAERDWWPLFTGGAAPPAWWRRHILPDPRRLPALVARLARRGLAEAWLRRLDPAEVRTAVAALAAGVGLSLPDPAGPSLSGLEAPPAPAAAVALLDAVVPEARRADLPPPARLLLVLALLADRRPAMLATRAAKAAFAAVAAGTLPPPAGPAPARRRRPADASREAGVGEAVRRDDPQPRRAAALRVPPAAARAPDAPPVPIEAPAPAAPAVRPAPAPLETPTAFGGLLFLLNALLALGLYGDFSRPERALPGLSPFGLLRLLGRSWFGRPFLDDPLHGLLVRLAGGSRADSARDFEAPFWSVPPDWLAPWPRAGPPRLGAPRRAPMLWHPAGFPLAQLDPAAPLTRARWVACLRLYLEARLARTLACPDRAGAVAMLCRRPARVAVDEEDMTVGFALDDHPIAIRLAGLDRDPGWIPAARRSVRYLFQ